MFPLSRLPTPVHPLRRLSEAWGIDLRVKRDDLTGFGLSGNKVRKLDLLLQHAIREGADTVITTGGLQSNHCRATAVACRQLGLEPVLLLRGSHPEVPDSNLLLDHLLGAQLRTCTPEEYRHERDAIMAAMAAELETAGRRPVVVPEGGSNALGSSAFAAACDELRAQDASDVDHVFVAVGSGGTLAGLAMGGLSAQVWGVAVCDDRTTFRARVEAIADDARGLGLTLPDSGWDVLEGYQGPAYGVATPEIWSTIAEVARLEGILLDPVYTGKAMHALKCEAQAGRLTGRVLFWHTGGAFGLFGRGHELPR